ncbi:hypothetical protein BH10PSE18_BH10PSE18_15010 [soil metagenome]
MTHMMTATGAEYHYCGLVAHQPGGQPVQIADIAHQLAQINRFHGAARRPYSVAEHSLLVSEIAQRNALSLYVQLAALMHDAHEIYTQDVSSPAKRAINFASTQAGGTNAWTVFEDVHAKNVRRHFGLLTVFTSARAVLHRMDLQALATERRDLVPYDSYLHLPWDVLGDGEVDPENVVKPIDWISLSTPEREAMVWTDWRDRFMDRFQELMYGINLLKGNPA